MLLTDKGSHHQSDPHVNATSYNNTGLAKYTKWCNERTNIMQVTNSLQVEFNAGFVTTSPYQARKITAHKIEPLAIILINRYNIKLHHYDSLLYP